MNTTQISLMFRVENLTTGNHWEVAWMLSVAKSPPSTGLPMHRIATSTPGDTVPKATTSIFTSVAITAAAVTGIALTAAPAGAATPANFALYCYGSPGKSNPTRIFYVGRQNTFSEGAASYTGIALRQTWVPGSPGAYTGGTWVGDYSNVNILTLNADMVCSSLDRFSGSNRFFFGKFE